MLRVFLAAAIAVGGCGLSLDVGPPDQQPTSDGGAFDGASRIDGGERDGALPPSCESSLDCDDLDDCDGLESCVDGVCVDGEPITCFDDDPCDGVDVCEGGACVTRPPESCANDGDPCNGIEVCLPGVGCTSINPVVCDDGIDCTDDRCDPATGECVHLPDDSLCTASTSGRCVADSGCQYGTCDATWCYSDGCWSAHCDGGACQRTALCTDVERCCAGTCAPTGCDDGNPCTNDSCGASGCVHVPNAAACSDGNACTSGDRCIGEACIGTAFSCSDGDPCTTETCDPAMGCVSTGNSPPGTPCNDRDACTLFDRCMGGTCQGIGARPCDDGNLCTADSCDALTGCVFTPRPAAGIACGTNAICDAAGDCVCASGWNDCDMNGSCECRSPCSGPLCVAAEPPNCATGGVLCIGSQQCCRVVGDPFYGTCGDPSCSGCCPFGT